MEINRNYRLSKKPKYWAIITSMLMTVFILAQPMSSYAFPSYDICALLENQPEDNITMNTFKHDVIAKTVHAEKELFRCSLAQTNFTVSVIADVTTYVEMYENIATRQVIKTSAFVVTCLYMENDGASLGCEVYQVSTDLVPVTACTMSPVLNPMEMNSVKYRKIVKTIEAEKKVWLCDIESPNTKKKVDVITFTETYENMETLERIDIQVYTMRCVVLVTDYRAVEDDAVRDAVVESCFFSIAPA